MRAIHLLLSIKQGGAENVAINYCKALRHIGIENLIIGSPSSNEYEAYAKQYAEVRYDLDAKLLDGAEYIFIHCNQWLPKLLKHLWLLKRQKKRVIYIQHLKYPLNKFIPLSFLINAICTDFIRITPITKKIVERYIFIKKHFIVNFYISKYKKEEWNDIRLNLRALLDISDELNVVCFSAIFRPGKGLSDFLELAKGCRDRNNYKFLLIGDGPERYLAEKYSYDNLVWTGRVTDVEKYLIMSDIYYFPSRFKIEMMPMALIEAINTGKKIIAYPTEINNFLLNGETFENITDTKILNRELPCGLNLKNYNLQYGIQQLHDLCFGC